MNLWRPYGTKDYSLPKGMDAFFITNAPYTHKKNFFSRKRKRWMYAKTSRTRATKRASIIPYLYKNSFAGAYIGSRLRGISKYSSYDKM